MNPFYINEPELFFKDGNSSIDPRIGLLNFGPNGLSDRNRVIKLAIFGDKITRIHTQQFLNTLKYRIPGQQDDKSNIRSIDFPGVRENGPLQFYFDLDIDLLPSIQDSKMQEILSYDHRWQSIDAFITLFDEFLADLRENTDRPLVLIPISHDFLNKCSKKTLKEKRIKCWDRKYRDLANYLSRDISDRPPLFDFHNYLKTIGFKYHIPTQLILPNTLEFNPGQGHDPATLAWNFSVSLYYKFSETPWKLADLNPETIHVGISFYNDITPNENIVMRAALAQVYMRNADAQIVRGLNIPLENEEQSKNTNLTPEQATDILNKSIDVFKRTHHNQLPTRIVVHKTSPYSSDELDGFKISCEGIPIQDYLHVQSYPSIRVITDSDYPISRGSVFPAINQQIKIFDIFTTGYIPALATYPGSQIPRPIRVYCDECASNIDILAKDMMNLTKLDWNSTDLAKRLPTTISVSKKVGKILGEINGREIEPPAAYAYYM